jgi:hypothetical protein
MINFMWQGEGLMFGLTSIRDIFKQLWKIFLCSMTFAVHLADKGLYVTNQCKPLAGRLCFFGSPSCSAWATGRCDCLWTPVGWIQEFLLPVMGSSVLPWFFGGRGVKFVPQIIYLLETVIYCVKNSVCLFVCCLNTFTTFCYSSLNRANGKKKTPYLLHVYPLQFSRRFISILPKINSNI